MFAKVLEEIFSCRWDKRRTAQAAITARSTGAQSSIRSGSEERGRRSRAAARTARVVLMPLTARPLGGPRSYRKKHSGRAGGSYSPIQRQQVT
jgi:hypothetical protein